MKITWNGTGGKKELIWVPAPGQAGGWTVSDAAKGSWNQSCAEAGPDGLLLKLGDQEIRLTDEIYYSGLEIGEASCNDALPAVAGRFPLFNRQTQIEIIAEAEGATVYRAATALTDAETGERLNDAMAYTDLYFWHGAPMLTVQTYFTVSSYTPVRDAAICKAEGDALGMMKGVWKKLTGAHLAAGKLASRDLREIDAAHPFVAHIALEKCALPEIDWTRVEFCGPEIVCGDLTVQLNQTEDGLALAEINDKRTGVIFSGRKPEPLFNLLVRRLDDGKEDLLSSAGGWESVQCIDTKAGPLYRFDRENISVELAAVLKPEISRIEWNIDVRLYSDQLTVVRLDPPAGRVNTADDTMLFISMGPGQAIPMNASIDTHIISPFPSIGVCMQYMAAWRKNSRRGLYFGCHDPRGCYKLERAEQRNGMCSMEMLIPAEGIDEPGNGFRMTGSTAWQLFDGDWYDATQIYREWVHRYACWFKGVPSTQRKDVPEWLLTMPVWINGSVTGEGVEWMDKLFEMQDDLGGIPAAVHMYHWHEIPFDTNYPHYKPEKAIFRKMLPVMQAHGLKVMPYINGRLWDTHDRGDYDYQFTSVAKPGATKDRSGKPIVETYVSRNSKGELIELAVMCPSSPVWQEKQREINNWLLNDLKVDAVYIDQIGAAAPVVCMDDTHPHRKGGGAWWYDHYRNLLGHLEQVRKENQCFTTESNGETYVGHIGGMLVWNWAHDYQVPAFPAVYAGYQPMLGRNYGEFDKEDDNGFRLLTAQSLCFGDQLGWVGPARYLNSPSRAFFRQLAQLRWQYGEYFYAGRCLRPPVLEGDVGVLNGLYHSDGVISAMWQRCRDGSSIAVVVNMTDEKRSLVVKPEGKEAFSVELEPVSAVIRVLE